MKASVTAMRRLQTCSFDASRSRSSGSYDKLLPVLVALKALTTRVEDTVTALGSDVMDTAQTGYGMLKMLGNEQGLDELRKELGYRWARSPRKKATPANDE